MIQTVKLEEDDNGDLILPLTSDILNQMGWDVGDELIWEELPSGSWSIKKKGDSDVDDVTSEEGEQDNR